MKLAYTHSYPSSPARVVELLRDPKFLEDLASHAGALSQSAEILDDHAVLTMKMPVPGSMTRFVGESIQLVQTYRFQPPGADGTVRGVVEVDVPGMPVDIKAEGVLSPSDVGTSASYEGDLKVKVPLVGKKAEERVAPFIREAFDGLERRATAWLSA